MSVKNVITLFSFWFWILIFGTFLQVMAQVLRNDIWYLCSQCFLHLHLWNGDFLASGKIVYAAVFYWFWGWSVMMIFLKTYSGGWLIISYCIMFDTTVMCRMSEEGWIQFGRSAGSTTFLEFMAQLSSYWIVMTNFSLQLKLQQETGNFSPWVIFIDCIFGI